MSVIRRRTLNNRVRGCLKWFSIWASFSEVGIGHGEYRLPRAAAPDDAGTVGGSGMPGLLRYLDNSE